MPPSFMEDTAATRTFNISDLIRDSHARVLSRVRDKFLTMMLEELSAGRLELNLVLTLSHLLFIGVIRWTSAVCCTRVNHDL